MNDKKNIERFFQEKFKEFEANPDPLAWDNISERINKKKNKKRAFPIWFKSIGIAASLIIGYFIFDNFSKDSKTLIEKDSVVIGSEIKQNDNNIKPINNKNETIIVTNDKKIKTELNEKSVNNLNNVDAAAANEEKANVNSEITITSNNKKLDKNIAVSNNKNVNSDNAVALNNNKNDKIIDKNKASENIVLSNKNKLSEKDKQDFVTTNNKNQQVVQNKESVKNIDTYNNVNNSNEIVNNNSSTKNNAIANNQEIKNNNTVDKNAIEEVNQINEDEKFLTANKNLTQEKLEENAIAKLEKPENALDKIMKEKTDKSKKKEIASNNEKWTIRPNVAPIFMESFTGSPIHDIFKDNEKDFENQLSIGLAADYAITSKISIRAGINKFDLAYNTNDVAFYADPSITTASLNTINFRPETQNLVVNDRKARGTAPGNIPQIAENGVMNQSFGYLEFPVEVSYKLFDSKIGLTLITGMSTLLLNKNEVSLISDSRKFVLGDANNLNNVHFSTNIGIGFKYKFWKSFEANVEPTLKYQINTFSYDSGGFNPYFLGIYSGISYRL